VAEQLLLEFPTMVKASLLCWVPGQRKVFKGRLVQFPFELHIASQVPEAPEQLVTSV